MYAHDSQAETDLSVMRDSHLGGFGPRPGAASDSRTLPHTVPQIFYPPGWESRPNTIGLPLTTFDLIKS